MQVNAKTVSMQPHFVKRPSDVIDLDEGQTAELSCVVESDPLPKFTWSKNGCDVLAGTQFLVIPRGKECRLRLPKVQTDDGGLFTCTATNQHGSVRCAFRVKVQECRIDSPFISVRKQLNKVNRQSTSFPNSMLPECEDTPPRTPVKPTMKKPEKATFVPSQPTQPAPRTPVQSQPTKPAPRTPVPSQPTQSAPHTPIRSQPTQQAPHTYIRSQSTQPAPIRPTNPKPAHRIHTAPAQPEPTKPTPPVCVQSKPPPYFQRMNNHSAIKELFFNFRYSLKKTDTPSTDKESSPGDVPTPVVKNPFQYWKQKEKVAKKELRQAMSIKGITPRQHIIHVPHSGEEEASLLPDSSSVNTDTSDEDFSRGSSFDSKTDFPSDLDKSTDSIGDGAALGDSTDEVDQGKGNTNGIETTSRPVIECRPETKSDESSHVVESHKSRANPPSSLNLDNTFDVADGSSPSLKNMASAFGGALSSITSSNSVDSPVYEDVAYTPTPNENTVPFFPNTEIQVKVDPEPLFDWMDNLGSGRFGTVRRCRELSTDMDLAVKVIRYRRSERDEVVKEVEIMLRLGSHPLIMTMHSAYDTGRRLYIFMEYVSGGELVDWIVRDEKLTEDYVADFVRQILTALEYMHSKGVIHRDLKPDNILLKSPGSTQIKLIDFGLATIYDPKNPPKRMVGTTLFIAPEVLQFEPQGFYTDIWSVAVVAYELLSGVTPFEIPQDEGDRERVLTNHEILVNIERCAYDFNDEGFAETSEYAKDFIRKLLVKNPKKRPTASECLQHEWFVHHRRRRGVRRVLSIQRMRKLVANRNLQTIQNTLRAFNKTPNNDAQQQVS